MKKIDNKGFVLLETVIVTVFIISIFTFIYISVVPLLGKYDELVHDYKADVAYKLYHIRDAIYKDGNFNSIIGGNYKKIEVSDFEDQAYYSSLMSSLFESEDYSIVYIRDVKARSDVAIASLGITGGFKAYIKKIVEKEASSELENFIFINDDGNYAHLGLAVDLDNLTDYKEPEIVEEEVHKDTSGANHPILMDGMIPVYYGEGEKSWKKADEENKSKKHYWYDYNELRWANIVLVKESKREEYKKLKVGEIINNDDVIAYYVWVPRYEYTIKGTYGDGGTSADSPGQISVEFINTTVSKNHTRDSLTWRTPEAFTFGNVELEGLWFPKFEMSSSESKGYLKNGVSVPYVVPEVISWTGLNIATFYSRITTYMNGNNGKNIYGLTSDTNLSDAHVMKNEEWGAVAYLSQSQYGKYNNKDYTGRDKKIYINNSGSSGLDGAITGSSGGITDSIGITINATCDSDASGISGCYKYFVNGKGTGASTTGTIYGIYDMAAGAAEMIMGGIGSKDDTCGTKIYAGSTYGATGFKGPLSMVNQCSEEAGAIDFPSDSKYYYQYHEKTKFDQMCGAGSSFSDSKCYSHAMSETEGWYGDAAYAATKTNIWYIRGGKNEVQAGIFAITAYATTDVNPVLSYTTRPVISAYRVSPVCSFSSPSKSALKQGEEATYTLTCTDSDSFDNTTITKDDIKISAMGVIEVTNIEQSSITGGYKYDITVKAGNSGEANISIRAGAVKDSEGNGNREEKSSNIMVDAGAPVCNFSGPSSSIIKENETATYTITCSDDSDFSDTDIVNSDIAIDNTDVVELTKVEKAKTISGYKYIVTIKGKSSGNATLSLKENSISDKIGNRNQLITSNTIEVDTIRPMCSFKNLAKSVLGVLETTTYAIECSEDKGFLDSTIDSSDIVFSRNGIVKISDVSKVYENNVYKYTVTLVGNNEGATTVSLKANAVSDKAGNANLAIDGSSIVVDATAPVCSFSEPSKSLIKGDEQTTYTLTCTDTVGFSDSTIATGDIAVNTSGVVTVTSVSSGTAVTNGYQYTVTVKGAANGSTTLKLNANSVKDQANKGNEESVSSSVSVDITAPSCSFSGPATSIIKKDATTTYTLTCTDTGGFSDSTIAIGDIAVNTSGIVSVTSVSSGTAVTNGYQYTVTIKGAANGSTTLKLNANAVSDRAGNKNAASSNSSSVTADITAPSCSFSGPSKSLIKGDEQITYTLTCTDTGGFSDYTIATGDIAVNTSGIVSVTSVSSGTAVTNGYQYTVTVKGAANGSTTLKLNANAVSDRAGNKNAASSNSSSVTVDTTAPSCSLSWNVSTQSFTASVSDNTNSFAYYGFNSSYSGTSTTTGPGYSGVNYYYVKDSAGNTNYCEEWLNTQYRTYDGTVIEECEANWEFHNYYGPEGRHCGTSFIDRPPDDVAINRGWYREDCYSKSTKKRSSCVPNSGITCCCLEYDYKGTSCTERVEYEWSAWTYTKPYSWETYETRLVIAVD